MMTTDEIDLENRDPNNLNDHVKVCFEDVIGEPDGAHSIDCVWKFSFLCFSCCKNCGYRLLTLFYGVPIAAFWGCEFAVITFYHVWYVTPCMRAYLINCGCIQKFYASALQCCLQPMCDSMGYCFNNIRVTNLSA